MKERPYQHLPPLEHRPDSFPYRMTPAQRKRATTLIRRECCNCDGGNCLAIDDGDTYTCPQMITFSVCCKWFRWAVLPLDGTLEAEIYRDSALKRCSVCGKPYVPKSNRGKYLAAMLGLLTHFYYWIWLALFSAAYLVYKKTSNTSLSLMLPIR